MKAQLLANSHGVARFALKVVNNVIQLSDSHHAVGVWGRETLIKAKYNDIVHCNI